MKMTMQFRVYCDNCDADGGYVHCLVSIDKSHFVRMQFPEEVLPKGWKFITPRSGKTYYADPICPGCFEILTAMNRAR